MRKTIVVLIIMTLSLGCFGAIFTEESSTKELSDSLVFCLIRGFEEKKSNEPKDVYKHSFMGSLYFAIIFAASVLIFK